jgi:hypothetical protein
LKRDISVLVFVGNMHFVGIHRERNGASLVSCARLLVRHRLLLSMQKNEKMGLVVLPDMILI